MFQMLWALSTSETVCVLCYTEESRWG